MTRFEYLLPFFSIIIGIAIADLLTSLHRLLRARARVRWHPLPLLAAAIALLGLVQAWWAFFIRGQDEALALGNLFWFLVFLPHPALLFLAAAAVLPDGVPDEGLDLKEHYFAERRYFYGLVALYVGHILALNLVHGRVGLVAQWTLVAMIAVAVVLALSERVWVHVVFALTFAGLLVLTVVRFSLVVG